MLNLAPMNKWEEFFYPHDMVLGDLNKIREFIFSTGHWKINVDEFVLQLAPSPPLLVSAAEDKWFAGVQSRAVIREPLVGYFLSYPLMISSEPRFHLALIKSSAIITKNNNSADWSGRMPDLVSHLHQGLQVGTILERELKVWIAHHHRHLSVPLSAAKCDSIARKVLSNDGDDSALDYDSSTEMDDLSPPTDSQRLKSIDNTLNRLERKQNEAMERHVEGMRKIYDRPLLVVVSRYQPSTLFGELVSFVSQGFGRSSYRAHFLCSVCGCKSPTAGEGYKLNFGADGTEHVLRACHMSLTFLQIMLNLGGVPNQISILAELATSSLDILANDLRVELLQNVKEAKVEEMDNMRDALVGKVAEEGQKESDVVTDRAVLLDSSKTVR